MEISLTNGTHTKCSIGEPSPQGCSGGPPNIQQTYSSGIAIRAYEHTSPSIMAVLKAPWHCWLDVQRGGRGHALRGVDRLPRRLPRVRGHPTGAGGKENSERRIGTRIYCDNSGRGPHASAKMTSSATYARAMAAVGFGEIRSRGRDEWCVLDEMRAWHWT